MSRGDRTYRDNFKLAGWVGKNAERRRRYFGWCDKVLDQLREVTGGEDPSDEAVVAAIALALQHDGTFEDHVRKNQGATALADDEDGWTPIDRAGAAQIFHEYLVAVEKNEWPETDG